MEIEGRGRLTGQFGPFGPRKGPLTDTVKALAVGGAGGGGDAMTSLLGRWLGLRNRAAGSGRLVFRSLISRSRLPRRPGDPPVTPLTPATVDKSPLDGPWFAT